jgi:hypothetical protein
MTTTTIHALGASALSGQSERSVGYVVAGFAPQTESASTLAA